MEQDITPLTKQKKSGPGLWQSICNLTRPCVCVLRVARVGERGKFWGLVTIKRKTQRRGRFLESPELLLYAQHKHTPGWREWRIRCALRCRPGAEAWSWKWYTDELITSTRWAAGKWGLFCTAGCAAQVGLSEPPSPSLRACKRRTMWWGGASGLL